MRRAVPETAALGGPGGSLLRAPGRSGRSDVRGQYRELYLNIALTDTLSVFAGLLLAYQIRYTHFLPGWDFWLLLALTPLLTPGVYLALGLYRSHQYSSAEELRRVTLAISMIVTVTVMVSFWSKASFSRLWILLSWLFALAFAVSCRRLWHWRIRQERRQGHLVFRTLIVGTNAEAEWLAVTLQHKDFGFDPIGFVSADGERVRRDDPGVLGPVGRLRDLVRETGAGCVFVASSAAGAEDVRQVLKARRLEDIEVRFTSSFWNILSTRLSPQPIGAAIALAVNAVQLTRFQAAVKRTTDVVVSALLLVGLSPLFAAIALAIELTSPGPVIFRQQRVGLRSRPFTLLKFRTMVDGAHLLQGGLRDQNEADGPLFKLRADPRVTRVGRLLRRYSLDELPQLVNVLRGEMSLVGPRPPLADEVARYDEWQLDRLEVRPGITGMWQVSGRSNLSFDDYVRLDLFYIENWSLAMDVFILAKTIPILLWARGAY